MWPAFPGSIPPEIMANEYDHRRPWIDPETGEAGDQGVPLRESILFEPRDGINPRARRALPLPRRNPRIDSRLEDPAGRPTRSAAPPLAPTRLVIDRRPPSDAPRGVYELGGPSS